MELPKYFYFRVKTVNHGTAIELEDASNVDVVEVVRCRDCTWWKSIFSWNGKEHKVCVRESAEPPRESDDYCSYGERREDAEAVNTKN